MKRILSLIILTTFTLTSITAYAHGGRTDKNGCHKDKKSGTRHCH